jgi:excisionase family DNA binding protein
MLIKYSYYFYLFKYHKIENQIVGLKMQTNTINQLLHPKQVAEKLQIHYRKVLDFIVLGELKAYKIGGVYRIEPGELFEFLQ